MSRGVIKRAPAFGRVLNAVLTATSLPLVSAFVIVTVAYGKVADQASAVRGKLFYLTKSERTFLAPVASSSLSSRIIMLDFVKVFVAAIAPV